MWGRGNKVHPLEWCVSFSLHLELRPTCCPWHWHEKLYCWKLWLASKVWFSGIRTCLWSVTCALKHQSCIWPFWSYKGGYCHAPMQHWQKSWWNKFFPPSSSVGQFLVFAIVLYHPSSGWVSLAFGQDPSHSDDDVTQYTWHSPLQSMASSLPSSLLLPSDHLLPSDFASIWANHPWATSLADFHKTWLLPMCLMTSAWFVVPITVEGRWRMW